MYFPYPYNLHTLGASMAANMKVITAIYLNCRPDLRDEWLMTVDVDADAEESIVSPAGVVVVVIANQSPESVKADL